MIRQGWADGGEVLSEVPSDLGGTITQESLLDYVPSSGSALRDKGISQAVTHAEERTPWLLGRGIITLISAARRQNRRRQMTETKKLKPDEAPAESVWKDLLTTALLSVYDYSDSNMGTQIVNGRWVRERYGCDTLEMMFDNLSVLIVERKPLGYVFNGRLYKSLDELQGHTVSDDNKPMVVYGS